MSSRCATCNLAFTSLTDMREHFQTDYHAHNVRLRVDGKPPATKSQFRDAANGEVVDERPQFACTLCKKTFQSIQTLQSHVKSTEHLMKKEKRILARDSEAASALTSTSLGSAALGLHRRYRAHQKSKHADPASQKTNDAPKVDAEQREADVDEKTCFFCGHPSENASDNLDHMTEAHGFDIPLAHRCVDLEGLLQYLARKINGCICFVCGSNSKHFVTLNGLRSHMQQCHHDQIVLSPEYNDFYDGELADPDTVGEGPKVENNQVALVDAKKSIQKRRSDGIQKIFRSETEHHAEQRRMITAASHEANAVILRERRVAMLPEKKKELKRQRHYSHIHNKAQMQLGVKANKLHAKGYDGEGETN